MTIETDLYTILSTNTPVKNLVTATRIYPNKLPQNPTYPAITYAKVSGLRVHSLAGRAGRARPRIAVHSWGETYASAKAVAEAVRKCLDVYNGTTASGRRTTFLIENEFDIYEDDTGVHHVVQDYRASHKET